MDFDKATDMLCRAVTHAEIAARIGCSVASVRQARLATTSAAHRRPPPGWQDAVRELARERAAELEELAARI